MEFHLHSPQNQRIASRGKSIRGTIALPLSYRHRAGGIRTRDRWSSACIRQATRTTGPTTATTREMEHSRSVQLSYHPIAGWAGLEPATWSLRGCSSIGIRGRRRRNMRPPSPPPSTRILVLLQPGGPHCPPGPVLPCNAHNRTDDVRDKRDGTFPLYQLSYRPHPWSGRESNPRHGASEAVVPSAFVDAGGETWRLPWPPPSTRILVLPQPGGPHCPPGNTFLQGLTPRSSRSARPSAWRRRLRPRTWPAGRTPRR
ncbi:hypothetical protein NB691_003344 [Xanthomonas sacchari]|nr:hypothetical protein [Xanthomonas sacchari]